jgi:hypothetical protein
MLTFAAVSRIARSAAVSTGLVARQPTTADCAGYRARNVVETATGLTADLTLAGAACNVYGRDIEQLKLSVNYDTGMIGWHDHLTPSADDMYYSIAFTSQNRGCRRSRVSGA